VSGACCPSPEGLLGSNLTAWPWLLVLTRDHWPFQLGYLLASSAACVPLMIAISARAKGTASTKTPLELRSNMIALPTFELFSYREGRDIHVGVRIHRSRGTPQSPSPGSRRCGAQRLHLAPSLQQRRGGPIAPIIEWAACAERPSQPPPGEQ